MVRFRLGVPYDALDVFVSAFRAPTSGRACCTETPGR
jgi:hypothetical protein